MPDVVIIGAGPAGSVAAALLANRGWRVEVFEHTHFPRFSIGESLLPQCMEWLDEAGLLHAVVESGFQHKNGAIFQWGDRQETFDFREKISAGWGTTYQVRRDKFDEVLSNGAKNAGAQIHFGHRVVAMQPDETSPRVTVEDELGNRREVEARFVLDGSGFGRVLSRLLDLELPSRFPPRMALFRHVADRVSAHDYDRNKILISINPINPEIWYWMIPLAGGMTSVGVVGQPTHIEPHGSSDNERFSALVQESGLMATLLGDAEPIRDVGRISGYACRVKQLSGPGYALLGNAGEFLDPIFSSGVTIALKSASLAAKAVDRHLKSESPDWEDEFAKPLMRGVDTFRAHVAAWYDGSLQKIIFHHPEETGQIKRMLTSVLAGYAWDQANPFVRRPEASLERVAALCG